MKRLALFCDGTWNDPDSDTNVSRLHGWVAPQDGQGVRQMAKYLTGVGLKPFERLLGGTVGKGLSANVLEGYAWLVQHYDEGDEIYLFGFSRGAYTARSVAGMIVKCGLLRRGANTTVAKLYERYRAGKDRRAMYTIELDKLAGRPIDEEERQLLEHSRRVPIRMIGVWDTVGALGVPWTHAPLVGRSRFYFHNTNPSVLFEHAYQAVAVDEHRGPYKPALWTRFTPDVPDRPDPAVPALPQATAGPRTVTEQRWFAGAHCNVGGGYQGDVLRNLPLAWIQGKADALGLAFTQRIALHGNEFSARATDSYAAFMKGAYRAVSSRFQRPIGAPARKVKGGSSTPLDEWIDASVFEKWRADPAYRPANLREFLQRRGLDPAQIRGDLRASAD